MTTTLRDAIRETAKVSLTDLSDTLRIVSQAVRHLNPDGFGRDVKVTVDEHGVATSTGLPLHIDLDLPYSDEYMIWYHLDNRYVAPYVRYVTPYVIDRETLRLLMERLVTHALRNPDTFADLISCCEEELYHEIDSLPRETFRQRDRSQNGERRDAFHYVTSAIATAA